MARKKAPEMKQSKHTRKGPKDFKDVKKKVGKTQRSANDTNVNFRSRQVLIPNQSNLVEKGDVVTGRQLNLSDLLAHCRHYNVNMRKEGLVGLRQLLQKFPEDVIVELSKLIDALTFTMLDTEDPIRRESRTLLKNVLESVPEGVLDPFGNMFAVHIRSALTHVAKNVRDDALQVLEMMLDDSTGRRILQPVASSLLNLTFAVGQNNRRVGKKQCLDIIRSVLHLQASAEKLGRLTNKTSMSSLVQPVSAEKSETNKLWKWCMDLFSQLIDAKSDLAHKELFLSLLLLIEALLEVSSIFSEHSSQGENFKSQNEKSKFKNLLMTSFPLQFNSSNARQQQLMEMLNLHICYICGKLGILTSEATTYLQGVRFPQGASAFLNNAMGPVESKMEGMVVSKGQLYLRALDRVAACGSADIQSIITNLTSIQPGDVVAASGSQEASKKPSRKPVAVKAADSDVEMDSDSDDSDEDVASSSSGEVDPAEKLYLSDRLILSVPITAAAFGIRMNYDSVPRIYHEIWPVASIKSCNLEQEATWVSSWPKILWYLKGQNPKLSEFIITLLLELAKISHKSETHKKAWQAVQGPLSLFFMGADGPATISQLPVQVQRVAVQLLGHYKSFGKGALLTKLASLIPSSDPSVAQLIVEMVLWHRREAAPLLDRMRFALTLLVTPDTHISLMRTIACCVEEPWPLAKRAEPFEVSRMIAFLEATRCQSVEMSVEVMQRFLASSWPELTHLDPTSAHPLAQKLVSICVPDAAELQSKVFDELVRSCIAQPSFASVEVAVALQAQSSTRHSFSQLQAWLATQDPTPRLRQLQILLGN